jgi:hypothetical protein
MDNNMYDGFGPDGTPTAPRPVKRTGRARLIAGVAAASVLAGGTAFGAVTILGGGAASARPTRQAGVRNSALTSAAAPATTVTDKAGHRHRRYPLARLRRLGGIDGQFTFETKKGPRTIAFERGTITSVAGGDVVVKAKDGTTWSWQLVSDSVVRESGKKTTTSALSAGETVFVGGPVLSGTHDARLIVIGKPKAASPSPSATSSASTSSSTA